MTRAEHVEWCKARAREYYKRGELQEAVTSMMSDLTKHEETKGLMQGPLAMLGMFAVQSGSRQEVERFVEGFN